MSHSRPMSLSLSNEEIGILIGCCNATISVLTDKLRKPGLAPDLRDDFCNSLKDVHDIIGKLWPFYDPSDLTRRLASRLQDEMGVSVEVLEANANGGKLLFKKPN
jgi:hypothetical protein